MSYQKSSFVIVQHKAQLVKSWAGYLSYSSTLKACDNSARNSKVKSKNIITMVTLKYPTRNFNPTTLLLWRLGNVEAAAVCPVKAFHMSLMSGHELPASFIFTSFRSALPAVSQTKFLEADTLIQAFPMKLNLTMRKVNAGAE